MRAHGFYSCVINDMNGDTMNRFRIVHCGGAKPDYVHETACVTTCSTLNARIVVFTSIPTKFASRSSFI